MSKFVSFMILAAMVAALLFGASGATVSAQDETWEMYRIEVNPQGVIYAELRDENNWALLVREDGLELLEQPVDSFYWSAASMTVIMPTSRNLAFYNIADFEQRHEEHIMPRYSLSGSFHIWPMPFENGTYLALNRDFQRWDHISASGVVLNEIGGEDIYPLDLIGNEFGFLVGQDQYVYDAKDRKTEKHENRWPDYENDYFRANRMGRTGDNYYIVEDYRTIRRGENWVLYIGIVNDEPGNVGIFYYPEQWWQGVALGFGEEYRLTAVRNDRLITATQDLILDCSIDENGVNCEITEIFPDN